MNRLDKLLLKARSKASVIGWPYITDISFIEALGLNPKKYEKVLPGGEVVYNMQRAGSDSVKLIDWDDEEGETGDVERNEEIISEEETEETPEEE